MSKLWLYTFLWVMVFSSGRVLYAEEGLYRGPEDFIAKDSSYYLNPTSSERIYLLQNSNNSLKASDHLVFLPPHELGLELKEVPQNLRLASVPVALTGVVALPLGRRFLSGALGSGKKVLLSVVGVGAVVGYIWKKIHSASSLDLELGVLASAQEEVEGAGVSPIGESVDDSSLAKDSIPPDPKLVPPVISRLHQDLLQQISEPGSVNSNALSAFKGYDDRIAVLSIAVAWKSLERVADHFKKNHHDGSVAPAFHEGFFDGTLNKVIEQGYPLLDVQEMIFNPQTERPHPGLGLMYGSPYVPLLISTMARLYLLIDGYDLTTQGVERIYEWWLTLSSSERTKILEFPSLSTLSAPMKVLAGAQKLAYYLQFWDINSDLAHRQNGENNPYPLILADEYKAAHNYDMSGSYSREMYREVRSFHSNYQSALEKSPLATALAQKNVGEFTKDDVMNYRTLFAQNRAHSLYKKTFLDLQQINQGSMNPWYDEKLADLKDASSP